MCCIGSITGGLCFLYFFFFFNDTATTEIYTLSLHDALPISAEDGAGWLGFFRDLTARGLSGVALVTSDAHRGDRKSTRLNSSHLVISYAVFCLKKKKKNSRHADHSPIQARPLADSTSSAYYF